MSVPEEPSINAPAPRDLLDLGGRVALVTGGGSGIGSGIALRFAEAGADVAVHYKTSREGADGVVRQIEASGGRAVALAADLTSREQVVRLVEGTSEALGGLDILINNAGIYPLSSLEEMREEEFSAVLDANLKSVFLCTQAAATVLPRGGAVVNVASIEGERPAPLHSHYNAAKAAVIMHTRAAALELGEKGIRVNAVSPGLIWRQGIEEQWPEGVERWRRAAVLERLGRAEDVADACLFLASEAARWITGVNLPVEGGVLVRAAF